MFLDIFDAAGPLGAALIDRRRLIDVAGRETLDESIGGNDVSERVARAREDAARRHS